MATELIEVLSNTYFLKGRYKKRDGINYHVKGMAYRKEIWEFKAPY